MCQIASAKVLRTDSFPILGTDLCVVVMHIASTMQANRCAFLRIGLLGESRAGKSTLCSVVSKGEPDDGNGAARLLLFRHRHEILAGKTSCVACESVAFDPAGVPLNAKHPLFGNDVSWFRDEMPRQAKVIIDFVDFAGDPKYVKTTLSALSMYPCDMYVVVVDGSKPLSDESKSYLRILLSMQASFCIIVNKLDLVLHEGLLDMFNKLYGCLSAHRKTVRIIDSDSPAASPDENSVPILVCSCTTLEQIPTVCRFFSSVQPKYHSRLHSVPEIVVEDWLSVPEVGSVVIGILNSGRINFRSNHEWAIGAGPDGDMRPVRINSVHSHRRPIAFASMGQRIALAVTEVSPEFIRKGMSIVLKKHMCTLVWTVPVVQMQSSERALAMPCEGTLFVKGSRQPSVLESVGGSLAFRVLGFPIVALNLDKIFFWDGQLVTVFQVDSKRL